MAARIMKNWILLLGLVFGTFSQAYAQRLQANEVARLYYRLGCEKVDRGSCQSGLSVQTYTKNQIYALPNGILSALTRFAVNKAQIWGDTILEGDYAADGKTQLDAVTVIRSHQQIIGYAFTYSERAWFTGNCYYDSRSPMTLRSCEEGRIRETAFTATDLSHAEVDQNQFADFVARD